MSQPELSYSDTHCHLILPQFNTDRLQVIERAIEVGVRRILVPGIDIETSRKAVALAASHEHVYAAVGLHPHQASEWSPQYQQEIMALAEEPKVVAIGEIGLDYHRTLSPPEKQRKAFRDQLRIASNFGLPVVIHNREAIDPLLEDLEDWVSDSSTSQMTSTGVLHAYSSGVDPAILAAELGFYFGVAGPITYKNAHERRNITSTLPLDRLLIETDSPYMPPHPFRGKRNEPRYVELVAKQLSQTFDLDLQSLVKTTFLNAARLFGWSHDD
jgi:TatD DNase family protein